MIDVASSREEFVARAVNHTVVPVRTALVSDDDTPVGAMTYSVARIRLRGRTVALKDRVRHVQAGAGSVLGLVGSRDNAECESKAVAVIQVVQSPGSLSALREDER